MNISLSLLLKSNDDDVLNALEGMLSIDVRPAFVEDVDKGWVSTYSAIKYIQRPHVFRKENNGFLFIEWEDSDHHAQEIASVFESIGCEVKFIHSMEEDLSLDADEYFDYGEFMEIGYFCFKKCGRWINLTEDNSTKYFPDIVWVADTSSLIASFCKTLSSEE